MHIQVELRHLRFGHEAPYHPGNARITGREEGIETLAAHINSRGKIDDLLVYDDGVPPLKFVANGNRSLMALRMIYGADSSELIDCKETTAERAYEDSLAVAVLARKFHPVDEYEAFAKLRDEQGKTEEEIAHQYGMTKKEVLQVLALGRLSPLIRDSWRKGEIKAEVAQAFTLAVDHKTQDRLFKKLSKENELDRASIREELGVKHNEDIGALVNFVGIDAYRHRGGSVTVDLFREQHIVSDAVLLKAMVSERLQKECDRLVVEDKWQWASIEADLPKSWHSWPVTRVKVADFFTPEEAKRAEQLSKRQAEINDSDMYDPDADEEIDRQIEDLETQVTPRAFTDKQKAKLGCAVDVDRDGRLQIVYGIKKPDEARLPSDSAPAPAAKAPAKPVTPAQADEEDISAALQDRLIVQLTKAAATALIQDEQLALSVLLAGFCCYSDSGVRVSVSGLGSRGDDRDLLGSEDIEDALPLAIRLKPAERIKLLVQITANALDFHGSSLDAADKHDGPMAIINAIDAKAFNAAARGAFDAKDYFAGVSKILALKAIEEALGKDLARQQAKNTKSDIVAFAVANVPPTGWLPLQLRCKGYDGPPKAKPVATAPKSVDRKKKPAPKKAAPKKAAKKTPAKKRKAA